ncbi:hypothetical protein EAE32_07960 [Kocuria tytonicola]|uniref:Amidohydrolase 3 domain-containing protein n=1 Tax=Kocuria tytonicola TaxID=2055946 RepID=A0A3L9L8Y9_9MICC|nr:hypothetical protein [Kocuria tytonicola]RLY95031.1 hypothetical protein EAE32_07960 [Kocuria tytonicola]
MTAAQQHTRVWLNGSVYSPADPFATALLVTGSTLAWVGSDDAARSVAGPQVTPGDLRAAVVTPAFVAHHRVADASRDAGALPRTEQGYGAVELLGADAEALAAVAEQVVAGGAHALPVLVRAVTGEAEIATSELPSPALGFDAAARTDSAELRDAARHHLVACTRKGIQAVLVLPERPAGAHSNGGSPTTGGGSTSGVAPTTETGSAGVGSPLTADTPGGGAAASSSGLAPDAVTNALLEAAQGARDEVGERAFRARGHRLVGVGPLDDEQCRRLAELNLTVSCRAGAAPLRELSRAGVPVTLMTDASNPWSAVKDALEAPEERLRTSARAAFLALTRGAWRAHPGGSALAGQLVPGAEAALAVWDAESVMVQQAQGTGASWSTDPRARTPVLPALDDARLPRCEATLVAGELVAGTEPRP